MRNYSPSEKEVEDVRAYGDRCVGCLRHKKDIMLSFSTKQSKEILDFFLTNE